MKKPNSLILFEFLLEGGIYKEDLGEGKPSYSWIIDDGIFGILGTRECNGKIEEVLLPFEMTIDQFIKMADKMPEEEVLNITASKVLRDFKKKDRSNVCNTK